MQPRHKTAAAEFNLSNKFVRLGWGPDDVSQLSTKPVTIKGSSGDSDAQPEVAGSASDLGETQSLAQVPNLLQSELACSKPCTEACRLQRVCGACVAPCSNDHFRASKRSNVCVTPQWHAAVSMH